MRFITSLAALGALATSSTFAQEGMETPTTSLDLSDSYNRLVLTHLIFGVLTFLVLVPAAILVARFGRGAFKWFPHHRNIQIVSSIFLIITYALGNVAAGPAPLAEAVHYQVGTAIFVMFWAQVALGLAAHHVSGGISRIIGWLHMPLGIIIFGLAMWQMQSGWSIWSGGYEPGRAPQDVLYAWMGLLILLYLVGLALLPKQIKHRKENNMGEKGVSNSSSNV
jgi:hypothetical protein